MKWQDLKEKTADLSLRERCILTGTVLVLFLFVWLQFVYLPYDERLSRLEQDKQQATQEIATLSEQITSLDQALANNPNDPLRREQKRLKEEMQEVREVIESRLSNLIAPEEMAQLMRDVLEEHEGLLLMRARNLPVKPLQIRSADSEVEEGQTSADQAVVFEHGFEISFLGSYFDTLRFIQRLETMSGFYWRVLDYEVQTYPRAKIRLQMSTLSLDEGWIGV